MLEKEFASGQKITWVSQAQGVAREKTGEVIQVIAPKVDASVIFDTLGPNARRKFDVPTSDKYRVMIKVPRSGKSQLFDVYCPVSSTLIKQMKLGNKPNIIR